MRELSEDIDVRNARMKHTSPFLAFDKTLYSCREHIRFKQYNPKKSAMAYCTEVSGILQYLTPTIAYHMLVN